MPAPVVEPSSPLAALRFGATTRVRAIAARVEVVAEGRWQLVALQIG